jgi:hypothetical protein
MYDKSVDILWTQHFLEAQGYTISANIVYQNNMSTLSPRKMATYLAPKKQITTKPNISSSNITTNQEKSISNTVPPTICGKIS